MLLNRDVLGIFELHDHIHAGAIAATVDAPFLDGDDVRSCGTDNLFGRRQFRFVRRHSALLSRHGIHSQLPENLSDRPRRRPQHAHHADGVLEIDGNFAEPDEPPGLHDDLPAVMPCHLKTLDERCNIQGWHFRQLISDGRDDVRPFLAVPIAEEKVQ